MESMARNSLYDLMEDSEAKYSSAMTFDSNKSKELDSRGKGRFVAGRNFFNYQHFGAIRQGGSVSLFSTSYFGLLFATAQSSFICAMLRYCMRETLMHSLNVRRHENSVVLNCLQSLPTTLSIVFGLLSDIFPIRGYRRKSYMMVGATFSFVMCLLLAILSVFTNIYNLTASHYIVYYMILIMGATLGSMLNKVAADARVIELSQREPLRPRGQLQVNYLLFCTGIEWLALWVTAGIIRFDSHTKNFALCVNPAWVYGTLSILSLLPVPFIRYHCAEDTVREEVSQEVVEEGCGTTIPSPPFAVRRKMSEFVQICQQRAMWQIVLFLSMILFTTRFYFGSAYKAFGKLAHVDPNVTIVTNALRYVTNILAMVLWKLFWTNSSWRQSVCLGIAVMLVPEVFRAVMMIYVPDVRCQVFYDTLGACRGFMDGMISIFTLIPATEIAEKGTEGATRGMFLSLLSIVSMATRTLGDHFLADLFPVKQQDGDTTLLLLLLFTYAVHTVAFSSVLLLPRQKLDAQQMRVYDGYSKFASIVMWMMYFAFFMYTIVMNIVAMDGMIKD